MELVLKRPTKSTSAKKYNILYVDDEETNLRIFNHAFKRDYHVFTALNGATAIEILESNKVDLIITDQQMPKMTGVDLLAKIVPKHPRIVRMIMTGFSDVGAIVRAVNDFGLDKYFTKPWNKDELKNEFDRALEKKSSENKINSDGESSDQVTWLNNSLLPKEEELASHISQSFILHDRDNKNTNSYWFGECDNKLVMAFYGSNDQETSAQTMNAFIRANMTLLIYKEHMSKPDEILGMLSKRIQEGYMSKGESESRASIDICVLSIDMANQKIEFCGANEDFHYFDKDDNHVLLKGEGQSIKATTTQKYKVKMLEITTISRAYLISKNILNAENPYSQTMNQLLNAMGGITMVQQSEAMSKKLNDTKRKTIIGMKF